MGYISGMFSYSNENELTVSCSQASKNLFRLAAILSLVFLLVPFKFEKQQTPLIIDDHGVGGGSLYQKISDHGAGDISEAESNDMYDDASETDMHEESALLEPESFSKTRTLLYNPYIVQGGDNISTLAINFGLNQDSILSINKIAYSRSLQIGKVLKIPNQDGIIYTVRSGDNLKSISERFNVDKESIQIVNELFSDKVSTGTELLIPGARYSQSMLQEINGDLFYWPVYGGITSYYGRRRDPFNSSRSQFHSGIDIRGVTGAPVRAAMAGRVSSVGYDGVFGNYIIINHHSGYRTLYGHLSVIRTRTGANVSQGERIGDVGNTGQSTGPHLHFTVYKNGALVNPLNLLR